MKKRSFGKLQLTRETLKNLTTEQLDKVAGGRTEQCTTDTSAAYSVCWKCHTPDTCPETSGCPTYMASCDGCLTPACTYWEECSEATC